MHILKANLLERGLEGALLQACLGALYWKTQLWL